MITLGFRPCARGRGRVPDDLIVDRWPHPGAASGPRSSGCRRRRPARIPRRLTWALLLLLAGAGLCALYFVPVGDRAVQLRRRRQRAPGTGDRHGEPAAARLVDIRRVLLHHRVARVRAGHRAPRPVTGRGAPVRRAHLHAHRAAGRAGGPGRKRQRRRGRPRCGSRRGLVRGRASRPGSCSRPASSAAPRSFWRTRTTRAPRSPSCSCSCCPAGPLAGGTGGPGRPAPAPC